MTSSGSVPAEVRERYAAEVCRDAGVTSPRLLAAFRDVPRERFVGEAPWVVVRPAYDGRGTIRFENVEGESSSFLYQNISVALDASRNLMNGHPGTAAAWIDASSPQPGETVVHAGCGSGYYTAILAELVGETGTVLAIEVDEALAEAARLNLNDRANVRVEQADGLAHIPLPYDVLIASFGMSKIPVGWTSSIRDYGRMIVPLAVSLHGSSTLATGVVFLFTRRDNDFEARMLNFVTIYRSEQDSSDEDDRRLFAALKRGSPGKVRSLVLERHDQDEECWLHGGSCCLSMKVPSSGPSGSRSLPN